MAPTSIVTVPSARAALAQELADSGILITMTHDAGNAFGRLETTNGVRRWVRADA